MTARLTDKQASILQFLIGFIQQHGYQPSREEMSRHFGICKTAVVHHLMALQTKGYIRLDPGRERAIELCHVRFRAELSEAEPAPA